MLGQPLINDQKKKSITDMLRRRENGITYNTQLKPQKVEKERKTKTG